METEMSHKVGEADKVLGALSGVWRMRALSVKANGNV